MEFEDEHDQEEEEEDDDDEGQQITIPPPLQPPPLAPPSYDSSGRGPHFPRVNSDRLIRSDHVTTRYRECLKNHAVNIGSHALDGCGEFMPAGDEGTLHALKCAACNCHRNFHRKETITTTTTTSPTGVGAFYYRTPEGYFHAPPRHMAHASTSPGTHSGEIDNSGGGNMTSMKKRYRTKFTQEQKDKLAGFAERLGWRIQKEDEEAVKEFCDEIQIKRKVLKVWMHNNKNTLGKKP